MTQTTLYWYDFESFGINPMTDRLAQFAGIRTDLELNIIGEPLMIYCKPANDFIPHPEACLITGITPQKALAQGLPESEFIGRINQEFSQPGSCVVGYNNIRFDDEFTRYTLYRNLYDPYAREWQNGDARRDLLDVVRLTRALRPEGIHWPTHPDGRPSLRLEDLTVANNLEHGAAHDALSDVYATIAVARLIKQQQPKLYQFAFNNRGKHQVSAMLNLHQPKPVVHISGMYPSERGNCAVVVPVAPHPTNKNGIMVYDLSANPTPLLQLDAPQIHQRLFTAKDKLPEGVERIPLKTVHINKCPIVAPLNTLDPATAERLGIDLALCTQHLQQIQTAPPLVEKLAEVLSANKFEPHSDPDHALYSGSFFSHHDKNTLAQIHRMDPQQLTGTTYTFVDKRLPEMLFRYRARNYPETLTPNEQAQWQEHVHQQLAEPGEKRFTLDDFFEAMEQCYANPDLTEQQQRVLEQLAEYVENLLPE